MQELLRRITNAIAVALSCHDSIKNKFLMSHAKKGDVSMEAWVGTMMEEVKDHPGDDHRRAKLTQVCNLILSACKAKNE